MSDLLQWQDRLLPLDNSSNGMHLILLEMAKASVPSGAACFLSEPSCTRAPIQAYMGERYEVHTVCTEETGIDFCCGVPGQWDIVIAQALIEHTCRPSILIENMLKATKPGGVSVLHTCCISFGYHAYPVDCVRMFPDFYSELSRYLPAALETFLQAGQSDFICYRKEE